MNKAMTALAFVFAFVLCAKAADGVSGFTHGTSFEYPAIPEGQSFYLFDADEPDQKGGGLYWAEAETNRFAIVTNYAEGAAYDYAARNMERGVNGCFTGTNQQYLAVDIDNPLERLVEERQSDGGISNVPVKVSDAYDGIYADTLVKFSPSVAAPALDGTDKIVVWMQETETNGKTVNKLVVTAGYYDGSYDNVKSADYVLEEPVVAADTWCRLTVCAISDITGTKRASGNVMHANVPGFVVYIDGTQAVASASCPIGWGYSEKWLTSSARVLIGERGLFPWLVRRGHDDAATLSRLSFSGRGAVDDMLFTTTRPSLVAADNIFTLQWDSGVKSMRCIVSNAVLVATNEIDAVGSTRCWDCRLGTNVSSVVTVTNVVYDAENGYSNGVWSAESGCRLDGCSFACYGVNPVGRVASSRNVVGVGAGGYETFAEAKARSKTVPIRLVLMTNMVVSSDNATGGQYADKGYLSITNGDDVVLDLHGCTLQGSGSTVNQTILQNGGKLRIVDTEGGGAVLPPAGKKIAVKSSSKSEDGASMGDDKSHVLDIKAGRYAGMVDLTVSVNPKKYSFCGVCIVDGGSYTNYNGGQDFYLEQCVTNASLYFGLDANGYWTTATNGFIWCGEGSNALWTTAENWKGRVVPGAGDLAIFPRITDGGTGWEVDFGSGVATKSLWLDADVFMAGTNEFSDVTVVPGSKGRLSSKDSFVGTATFTGALPDALASSGDESGKIRLGSGWRGTVRISKIAPAKILKDITWWGIEGSKVEFAGVRGYLSDKAPYALQYELVLTDADGAFAWQNDTGFTGSTVSFPKLSGSGTFYSPKNLREITQVFQFEAVTNFCGSFNLGGKRLLLGTGIPAAKSKAGDFTFANGVEVRNRDDDGKELDWKGVNAHFGQRLVVYGDYGKLMSYDKSKKPAVDAVVVTLITPNETTNGWLKAEDGVISVVSGVTATSGGKTYMVENLANNLRAGSVFEIPDGSAVMIDGNRVVVNGVNATFADYYTVQKVDDSTYAVQFDEKASPTLVDFMISEDDGTVTLAVENADDRLLYGLQTTDSLAEEWQGPAEWRRVVDGEVTFGADDLGAAKFFRVIVTDKLTP